MNPGASAKILIAGVGNIFFGDDAFGVEVLRALRARTLPEGVTAVDFGIRGLDLAYALLEPWDLVIIVDAVGRGGDPGALYLLEPEIPQTAEGIPQMDGHSMDPFKVLQLAAALGAPASPIRLIGCEPVPTPAGHDDVQWAELNGALSQPVQHAIEPAIEMIESLLAGERHLEWTAR